MVITAAFGLIASPISWGHHWIYVVPAIVVLVADGIAGHRRGWLIVAAVVAAVFHAAAFLSGPPDAGPLRLLAENSFAFTGFVLIVGYAGPSVYRAAVAVLRRVSVEQPAPVTTD